MLADLNQAESALLIGERVDRTLEDMAEVVRHAIVPGHVFEELGVTYEITHRPEIERER